MTKINNISFFLLASLFAIFVFHGCVEDGDNTLILPSVETDRYVDITNPQDLQNALKITQSNLVKGDLPESSSGNNYLSTSINSIQVNSGGTVILPLIYTGGYSIKKVYIQVIGAEGYFSVTPTFVVGSDGFGYISINVPKNIDDGEFSVQYLVEDSSGNISNVVTTAINVTNEVISCENAYASGSSGLTFTTLYLGDQSGDVSIYYNTYSIPDRIDVYQGKDWITGTGTNPNSLIPPMCDCGSPLPGFVGKSGYFNFYFDASKGQNITVVVSGCLNSGTSWEWALVEAPICRQTKE